MIVELRPTPVLRFNPDQLENVRRLYGLEQPDRLLESIQLLENWVRKQNHFLVTDVSVRDLELCLVSNKGSLEKAKKRLDKNFTLRSLMPELMQDLRPKTEFQRMRKYIKTCVLPSPTRENYRVLVDTISDIDDDLVSFINYARSKVLMCEYLLNNDYSAGYSAIVDLRGAGVSLLGKVNPLIVQRLMVVFIEGYSASIKGIHLISPSKFVETIVAILKQSVSDKLAQRFHVHSTPEGLLKFFPKSMLPSDLGGDEKSVDELTEIYYSELCSEGHCARLEAVQQHRSVEEKRLSDTFTQHYLGMPGSFRALSVD